MTIEAADGSLRVELSPLERLLGLWRSFAGALDHVSDVRVASRRSFEAERGVRAPGTAVPGRIVVGTLRGRGGRQFRNVRAAERALVVDLEGARFDRLVLDVPQPDRTASELHAAADVAPAG